MAQFPPLQGQSTTGKIKSWTIRVFEDNGSGIIEIIHGYLDGKKQTIQKTITEGKNLGKKNETNPIQQAISEARSTWIKRKESGYYEVPSQLENATDNEDDEKKDAIQTRGKGINDEVPSPMLAHDFNKRAKDIKFPCYVQRKYDGTRCVAIPNKGLFSRNRKTFPHLKHILSEINKLHPSIVLDGELYSEKLTFQEIVGLVKKETLKEDDEKKQLDIKFHVYDIINYDMPYHLRYANLQMLFKKYKFKHIVFVKTELCQNKDEIKQKHAEYVTEGYEGIMLRNKDGLYSNSRSINLQKFKEFIDDEFEVVDYKEGEGQEEGCVLWVCKTTDGKLFHCRPRGSREERQTMFLNGNQYIGKKLTIRYQELTDDNKPRFPVGISFRDYE